MLLARPVKGGIGTCQVATGLPGSLGLLFSPLAGAQFIGVQGGLAKAETFLHIRGLAARRAPAPLCLFPACPSARCCVHPTPVSPCPPGGQAGGRSLTQLLRLLQKFNSHLQSW